MSTTIYDTDKNLEYYKKDNREFSPLTGSLTFFLYLVFTQKILKYLKNEQPVFLDCGCGGSLRLLKVLSQISRMKTNFRFQYLGFDSSEKMIQLAKESYSMFSQFVFTANMAEEIKLPYNVKKFNAITLFCVLHTYTQEESVLIIKNLKKYLSQNGVMCFMVGRGERQGLAKTPEGISSHIEEYNGDKLERLLQQCDLKVLYMKYFPDVICVIAKIAG